MSLRLAHHPALVVGAILAAALIVIGCEEVTQDPMGQGGRAGSSMGSGAAGSAGSAGSAGTSMGGSGPAARDAGPETGSGNGGSAGFMYPDDCPTPSPIPANDSQVVVVQSVNFDTSEIVIRNVSSGPLIIVGGDQGWQWCSFPAYNLVVTEDVTLEPDQTLAFKPINQQRVWPMFRGEAGDPNELGIYVSAGGFFSSDLIAAFVSWGAGLTGGREIVATQAEIWTFGDRVAIGAGDDGFIITGNAGEGAGYTSVPARCLVAPPNPPGTVLPAATMP